jgi:nitrate/TMAO reductase-like tetraheme cytochrome c subunit
MGMTKRRFPAYFYNSISGAGALIAAVSFLAIVFLTLVDTFQSSAPAYIGVISYIVLPLPLIAGLLLVSIGAWRERRWIKKGHSAHVLRFNLDFSDEKQRRALSIFLSVTIFFLLFSAYGSYRVFEWTESVEFCGTTCHTVMEPEHTAYMSSPHARVKCVECHVGSGAGWYARSKLSGAYQVYAVLANVYPRPIPTPVHNLRPAQETCEQCHWPSHFSGEKKVVNTYFRSDEKNTRWTVALLMKIGGGYSYRGPESGIHWHMNIANEILYAAVDTQRQVIPWVRSRNLNTGTVEEFRSTEVELSQSALDTLQKNRLDCIDCHNRPSHVYRPPVRLIDQSLAYGRISTELPNVRTAAIQALVAPYSSSAAAQDSIPKIIAGFYQEKYPEVAARSKELIDGASREVWDQYRRNFFPTMGVSWKAYPNNIGHMTDIGCFRCHDGKHVSPSGKVISKDCNSCHTILYQGTDPVPTTLNAAGLPFQHPEEVGDAWKEINCKECHTGQ